MSGGIIFLRIIYGCALVIKCNHFIVIAAMAIMDVDINYLKCHGEETVTSYFSCRSHIEPI